MTLRLGILNLLLLPSFCCRLLHRSLLILNQVSVRVRIATRIRVFNAKQRLGAGIDPHLEGLGLGLDLGLGLCLKGMVARVRVRGRLNSG